MEIFSSLGDVAFVEVRGGNFRNFRKAQKPRVSIGFKVMSRLKAHGEDQN